MAQSTPPTLKHESLRGERNGARGERRGAARVGCWGTATTGETGCDALAYACRVFRVRARAAPWAMGHGLYGC